MTVVMWVGMEKIIEDMAGHREEVEGVGDMTRMEEVLWQDQGKFLGTDVYISSLFFFCCYLAGLIPSSDLVKRPKKEIML